MSKPEEHTAAEHDVRSVAHRTPAPAGQQMLVHKARRARFGSPISRWLTLCLALVALSSPLAAADKTTFEIGDRLRVDVERNLDDTLARLLAGPRNEQPGEPSSPAPSGSLKPKEIRPESDPVAIAPNREIQSFLTHYRGRGADRVLRGLNRFVAYRPQIVTRFGEHGVPPELALVGLVESSFDPLATSPKGARGIWQFMPETAQRYGLRVGPGVDERTDLEKSTHAAARHLADLYELFGDWPLALAAYNAGEKRVLGAIARSGRKDFWSLSRFRLLPTETREYVPAVLATILFAQGQGFAQEAAPPQIKSRRILFAAVGLSEL